jgi:hypothetical protein
MTTTQKNLITVDFMIENLDNFFDAYFERSCKVKSVEQLILRDEKLWNNFFNDPKFMNIDLNYLQGLFNQELKEWRKDFTQYFA